MTKNDDRRSRVLVSLPQLLLLGGCLLGGCGGSAAVESEYAPAAQVDPVPEATEQLPSDLGGKTNWLQQAAERQRANARQKGLFLQNPSPETQPEPTRKDN